MSVILSIVIIFCLLALAVYGVEYFMGGPIKPLRILAAVLFGIYALSAITGHGTLLSL